MPVPIISYTCLALLAFAANSILCRLALATSAIDPVSFTIVRLLSGAIVLVFLAGLPGRWLTEGRTLFRKQSRQAIQPALMLFIYALAFSLAYTDIDTATGALLLFGSVQLSVLLATLLSGQRMRRLEWLGMAIAFGGFIYLLAPGLNTPNAVGFVLMTLAGIAWARYTLLGRGSQQPLQDTAYNFLLTLPWLVLTAAVAWLLAATTDLLSLQWTLNGLLLAVASGTLASAVGYAIWYRALTGLSATQAGVVQLLVPVIAAIGGLWLVNEPLTIRITIALIVVLGGIALVFAARRND